MTIRLLVVVVVLELKVVEVLMGWMCQENWLSPKVEQKVGI